MGPWSVPIAFTGSSLFAQYSASQTGPWHDPPFVAGSDRYQRQRIGTGPWSAGYLIVGENGSNGEFTDYKFRRAASQPATPTGNNPSGWVDAPPTGADPLWMVKARKTAQGNLIGSWSIPARLTGEKGTDGVDGVDGTNGNTGGELVVLTDRIGTTGNSGSVSINAVANKAIIVKIQGTAVGFPVGVPPGSGTLRIKRGATVLAEITISIAYSPGVLGLPALWNSVVPINLVADDPTPSAGNRVYTSEWTAGASARWAADVTSPVMTVEQVQ